MEEHDHSSDVKTKEDIVKEITQLRKNIKQKHRALKRDMMDSDEMWENKLKPISEPLKILVEEGELIKQQNTLENNQNEVKVERKRKTLGMIESTPAKMYLPNPPQGIKRKQKINHPILPDYESDYDYGEDGGNQLQTKRIASHHSNMEISEPQEDENQMIAEPIVLQTPQREETFESATRGEELLKTPQGKKQVKEFIEQTFKGKIARDYFLKLIQGGKNVDHNFGVRVEGDSWMIGNKTIEIDYNDIIIDGVKYQGTPGLYELIFMNIPNEYIYTEEDLNAYAMILNSTSVHKTNHSSTGRVKSNRGIKYKNIISQIITRTHPHTDQRQRDMMTYPDIITRAATGSGILLSDSQPQYIYYDDPNELVDRLRTLLASQQAGNTAHSGEINSIMEELYELKPQLSTQINDVTSE